MTGLGRLRQADLKFKAKPYLNTTGPRQSSPESVFCVNDQKNRMFLFLSLSRDALVLIPGPQVWA